MNEKAAPIKATGEAVAWVTGDYEMDVLMRNLQSGDEKAIVNAVALSGFNNNMEAHGWVKVGRATVTIEIAPVEDLQSQQLATLVAQLEKERADSMVRQNALTDKISKLQALSYSGPFVDPGLVDDEPF